MEIDVISISSAVFINFGYISRLRGVYIGPRIDDNFFYWGSVSYDKAGVLISLGVITPSVNKAALSMLKECSSGRIKPQFPAHSVPPFFIEVHKNVSAKMLESELSRSLRNFHQRHKEHAADYWLERTMENMPYGPSQIIILPYYLYKCSNFMKLGPYISNDLRQNVSDDIRAYLDRITGLTQEYSEHDG